MSVYKIYVQNIAFIRVKEQLKSYSSHNYFINLFFIEYIIQNNIYNIMISTSINTVVIEVFLFFPFR